MQIPRSGLVTALQRLLRASPVVALLGPRQAGKTTLARQLLDERPGDRFDLEDPRDAQRLSQPMTALEHLRGLVVIDEVQRAPDLFPVLRVLADRRPLRARFLLLGSASPELLRQSSESLAGRIRFLELGGLSLAEVGPANLRRRLVRGGFPPSYLARTDRDSFGWREDFVRTFIERDLVALAGRVRSPAHVRRLWTMLAHRQSQVWNGAALASALGESYPTVKSHLELLCGALMVRQLPPYLPNAEKRLVKSPKVFVRDCGLVHALLGIRDFRELEGHPVLGASWEGFVLEELIQRVGDRHLAFWSTHAGAELDFVLSQGRGPIGFEVKWSDAPKMTKSMHVAKSDLGLRRLFVVYPGPTRYVIADGVEALPISDLDDVL
ncbi:MAG: ATP-binding protein [Myxococcales bacterium]|nr:ATP-binding protein [Myxococcales bacterium]